MVGVSVALPLFSSDKCVDVFDVSSVHFSDSCFVFHWVFFQGLYEQAFKPQEVLKDPDQGCYLQSFSFVCFWCFHVMKRCLRTMTSKS